MSRKPVEWVLVIFYGSEAHRATYGRDVRSNKYTKDYIQLYRTPDFIDQATAALEIRPGEANPTPLTYRWPGGSAEGSFVMRSSDRPHLKWETHEGAPLAWKMTPNPREDGPETIPGYPDRLDFESAEKQRKNLLDQGAGQPFLLAAKLRGEHRTLHLRAYLRNPSPSLSFADLDLVPAEVKELALTVSSTRALAWRTFESDGVFPSDAVLRAIGEIEASPSTASWVAGASEDVLRELLAYLSSPGSGVFFDPSKNHDCWSVTNRTSVVDVGLSEDIVREIRVRGISSLEAEEGGTLSDAAAEVVDVNDEDVEEYRRKIDTDDYGVDDAKGSTKVRGAAQKAFADAVKANYGHRCAITGIATRSYLVGAHIVPWSQDKSIRLDPSNGICLSLIVDKAFEVGHLIIDDNYVVRVQFPEIENDESLLRMLSPYDGSKINLPVTAPPKKSYLERRRNMFS